MLPLTGVWIRQPEVSGKQAQIHMETRVCVNHRNRASYEGTAPEENGEITVETGIYGPDGSLCMQERTAQSQQIAAGVREELLFCQDFLLESPVLWDTENPALYKAVTKIYKDGLLLDEVCTVTGFRNVRFDNTQGFLLNGVRVKLNGVCVHHDGGCAGGRCPPADMGEKAGKAEGYGSECRAYVT